MSKKLMPRSSARWRMETDSGSSSTQLFQAELPMDMVPRQSCDTSRAVLPKGIRFMRESYLTASVVPAGGLDVVLEEGRTVSDPHLGMLLRQEPLHPLPV